MFNEIFNNLIKLNQIFDKNKKVVIFGAGSGGKATFFVLKNLSINPVCFVDNNPSMVGSKIFDIPIEAPSCLLNESKDSLIILIASVFYEEISEQLINMGFEENINYFRVLNPRKPLKIDCFKRDNVFSRIWIYSREIFIWVSAVFFLAIKPLLERIGAFCSIAQKVAIPVGNHPLNHIE